jgi:uncharacterized membrane protein
MDNMLEEPTMSIPSIRSFVIPGLVGGLVLNLVDTPWSVVAMVPRLQAFTDAHQLAASPLVGPWFLMLHFALCVTIAWLYALARAQYRAGPATALLVGGVMLVINRGFGLANVLMGLIPLDVFLGFSISFVVGVLSASWVIGWMMDRASSATGADV